MNQTRPILPAAIACALGLIVACGGQDDGDLPVVAIANLLPDPSLLEVISSLKAELARQGYVEGETVRYIEESAGGDIQLSTSIARDLVAKEPDVIVPLTTPLTQAVVKVARGPVVFSVISTPIESGIVETLDPPHPTITGVLENWPVEETLALIERLSPGVRRLGVLFDSGADPSIRRVAELKRIAPRFGLEIIEGGVTSPTEVYPTAQNVAARTDALILSIDGTIARTVSSAVKAALEAGCPVYVGAESFVRKGGLAAVSASYHEIGVETGKLVARVLAGERNLPIVSPDGSALYLNARTAERLGIEIPSDMKEEARAVFTEIEN